MAEFWDAATTPVAIIFFIPLGVSLVLWLVSMIGILDIGGDIGDGFGEDAVASLGLGGVPPLVVFSIVSLIAWFLAVVAALFFLDPLGGMTLVAASAAVFVMALATALFLGSRLARPLGRLMETATAPSAMELVGREATVRSGRVDAGFGYADAIWDDGSMSRIDVRDGNALGLGPGDTIRLMSWNSDSATYGVTNDDQLFGNKGDN